MSVPTKKWDPFRDLLTIQERMSRLFDESLMRLPGEEGAATGTWTPAVDICETEEAILVRAELPGLPRNDIIVEVKDNLLVLRGERRLEKDVSEENFHRIERAYGKFYRTFTLPNAVIRDQVSASFKDGVLEITLPKVERARHREVEIQMT